MLIGINRHEKKPGLVVVVVVVEGRVVVVVVVVVVGLVVVVVVEVDVDVVLVEVADVVLVAILPAAAVVASLLVEPKAVVAEIILASSLLFEELPLGAALPVLVLKSAVVTSVPEVVRGSAVVVAAGTVQSILKNIKHITETYHI